MNSMHFSEEQVKAGELGEFFKCAFKTVLRQKVILIMKFI